MKQQVEIKARDAILVEDAALIRMMGMPVLEALPSRGAPYERTDPFILVHEGRFRLSEMASKDTKHPHRGFDNLWYVLRGSASTGHNTGPGTAHRAPDSDAKGSPDLTLPVAGGTLTNQAAIASTQNGLSNVQPLSSTDNLPAPTAAHAQNDKPHNLTPSRGSAPSHGLRIVQAALDEDIDSAPLVFSIVV